MVKEKPNSTRIYDEEGFRRRAACICVKSELEKEVLLVTSSRRPDHWIIPGGGMEPEEESSVTAIREVLEEAGVCGKLGRCLGVFENSERKHRTEVFVLVVTEELPEWEDSKSMGRKRKWFTVEDALEQLSLHKPVQLAYLQSLLTCRNDKCGYDAYPYHGEEQESEGYESQMVSLRPRDSRAMTFSKG